jgi:Phosphatidylglycerophosphate synthase
VGVLGLTWVGLAVVAGCLLVVSLDSPVGAGRAEESLSDRAGYLRRWSALHGDHDPSGSPLTVWWLDLVRLLATPLAARGVRPGAVTGWGVWAATAVAVACAGHGHWTLLGVLAVVASGVADNLDGAVAVLSGRVSRFGYVLDSLADRCADTAYVLALFLLGAPGWLCVVGGGLAAVQEYTRARAGNAGMGQIGVVTVSERPTRVLVTAFTLLGAGLWPGTAGTVATLGAAAWTVLGLVGCTQVLVAVHAALRD